LAEGLWPENDIGKTDPRSATGWYAAKTGQTKHVFVYKLIAAGSIEEKILAQQERNAALADGILSDDAEGGGKFSEVDIGAVLAPLPI
jgi:SNF2 family DNA or RNA helicase